MIVGAVISPVVMVLVGRVLALVATVAVGNVAGVVVRTAGVAVPDLATLSVCVADAKSVSVFAAVPAPAIPMSLVEAADSATGMAALIVSTSPGITVPALIATLIVCVAVAESCGVLGVTPAIPSSSQATRMYPSDIGRVTP